MTNIQSDCGWLKGRAYTQFDCFLVLFQQQIREQDRIELSSLEKTAL